MSDLRIRCPHCGTMIDATAAARQWGSDGGSKSKRALSTSKARQLQRKSVKARRRNQARA